MPVVAIAGAALALGTGGAGAIGGVLAGAFTVSNVLGAVAAVGATLGAVGAITGDETLSTVGMVMGGIGGVGALAVNAGLFGANAGSQTLFGSAASELGEVASTPVNSYFANEISNTGGLINGGAFSGQVLSDLANATDAGFVQQASYDFIQQMSQPTPANNALSAVLPQETVTSTTPGIGSSPASSVAPATGENAAAGVGAGTAVGPEAPKAPGAGTPSSIPAADQNFLDQQYRNPAEGTTGVNKATGNSYTFSKATGWVPTPSEGGLWGFLKTAGGGAVGMGVLQAGGAFLKGAFDETAPAQAEAYRAQAAANAAAAALAQKQVDNMGGAIPVARRVVPSGAAVTGAPSSLINNQPPARSMLA